MFGITNSALSNDPKLNLPDVESSSENNSSIYVEVSGSIEKPNVYRLKENSRLKELIETAGGLSEDADRSYFNRNFNLARKLVDGEKIYIPSVQETQHEVFSDDKNLIQTEIKAQSKLININTASIEELDKLSGIGQITAQKIIDSRPYANITDLTSKKIVGKSLFEKIKDQITI